MSIYSRGLVSVLGIFAVILSSLASAEERQILPSVVRIQVITPNGTMRGTGFAVEGGIVTATTTTVPLASPLLSWPLTHASVRETFLRPPPPLGISSLT